MNGHELLTDYFCKDLRGGHMVNEERGRMPFMERVLDDLIDCLGINPMRSIYKDVIYKPGFNAFFNTINITELKINIIPPFSNQQDSAEAYFDSQYTRWTGEEENRKLDIVPIYIEINSKPGSLLFNFRRIVGHELMHAYEFYTKGITGKELQTNEESDFYEWIKELLANEKRDDYYGFAYLYYMADPKEIRAFCQAIQAGYSSLRSNFGLNYTVLPFKYCYANIREFRILDWMKNKIKKIFDTESDDEIVKAMSYVSRTKFTSIRQVKRKIKALLFNANQSFNKALSRAIEDFAIRANRCTYAHTDPGNQIRRKNKLNEIYKKYGDERFREIYGKT